LFKHVNISIAVALLVLLCSVAQAGNPPTELGLPYITSFVPDEYGGMGQNWGITQSENGMMYLANGDGVFEYDGVKWTWLEAGVSRTARSIASGPDQSIYVGYHNEIGFWRPDSSGEMVYTSLTTQVSDSLLGFRDVWTTLIHDNYVYFNPIGHLFRWEIGPDGPIEGTLLELVLDDQRFQALSVIDDRVLVLIPERGLMELVGDRLVMLPGTSREDLGPVWSIMPFTGDHLLLAGYEGMFIYDGAQIREWNSDISRYSAETGAYNATHIRDQYYAIGTDNDGVALFDASGSILQIINRDLGLPNNQVLTYPYVDDEGGIWVCLEFGLARIDLVSNLQRFDHKLGLEGGAIVMRRFKGTMYVGTSQGLYSPELNEEPGRPVRFNEVGSLLFCWDMEEISDQLLLAANGDLQVIPSLGKEPQVIDEGVLAFSIAVDTTYDRAFVGCTDGPIRTYIYRNGEWRSEGEALSLGHDVMWLTRADDGAYWANYGFDSLKVARIEFFQTRDSVSVSNLDLFAEDNGYLEITPGIPFQWGEKLLIGGLDELYQYDSELHKLVVADDLPFYEIGVENGINLPANAPDGSVWFEDDEGICNHLIPEEDGNSFSVETPLRRTSNTGYNSFYPEEDYLWAGLIGSHLVRYKLNDELAINRHDSALIRNFRVGIDSILFRGAEDNIDLREYPIHWADRTVRIEYALPCYEDVTRNSFQVRLIGLSDTWSAWTNDTSQLYNNLAAGHYRFELRGRGVHGNISDIASVRFVVNPPWYSTWWATSMWLILAMSIVFGAVKLRMRAAEMRNKRLDILVKERTAELEKLRAAEQDAEIKASQMETAYKMAATIAHEFNNPLAIIQASSQLMAKDEFDNEKLREFAEKIPPQVMRLKDLLQRIMTIDELREIDYAAGMKILDIYHGKPPNGSYSKTDKPIESDGDEENMN
jgi:His Kinase A (phospho-acceptor) domain